MTVWDPFHSSLNYDCLLFHCDWLGSDLPVTDFWFTNEYRMTTHLRITKDQWRTKNESQSELLYDWRFAANQFVLATSPLRPTTSIFYFPTEHLQLLSLCNILSEERIGLSFTITAGPCQRIRINQLRVPPL
jgi:hypothetical protein